MALGIIGKIVGPLAVAGITAGIGVGYNLNSRIASVEAHAQDQVAHVAHIETRLDTVDENLGKIVRSVGRIEGELRSSEYAPAEPAPARASARASVPASASRNR